MVNYGGVKPSQDMPLPVIPRLSVTPSEAMRLAEKGIPVSTLNAASFSDGSFTPPSEVPFDRRRSIDVAQLWECQKDIYQRVKTAHLKDSNLYG